MFYGRALITTERQSLVTEVTDLDNTMKLKWPHSNFAKSIKPHVELELTLADSAKRNGDTTAHFHHLENAHVLGQESTYWHVKVHALMLVWAVQNRKHKEVFGQLFRIVGAATKTAIGLIPSGNTGGSNVNPFRTMPLTPKHESIIRTAKGSGK